MNVLNNLDDIATIIVTYNPKINNLNLLINALLSQGLNIFIIDNNSVEDINSISSEFRNKKLQVYTANSNLGIAAAQNIGLKLAFNKGFKSIFLLDQDSQITNNFSVKLTEVFNDPLVNIVAPVYYDVIKGYEYPLVDILPSGRRKKYLPKNLSTPIDISVAISSGMLIRRSVFDKVGMFDEGLFIDYVDTEWCLRCASHDISIRIHPSAVMNHSIGEKSLTLLGFRVPVHSPVRRYYRIRNAFHLLRMKHVPKLMAFRELLFGLIHQLILIALQTDRKDYLIYYLKAVRDGIAGKYGQLKTK